MTENILKDGRFIYLLSIIIELIYFDLSLATTSSLLMTVIAFPSLFVLPGVMLLAVLRRSMDNMVKLVVEGFFVSTVMLVILTSFMLMLNFPLNPYNYSLTVLIFMVFLGIIALIRKTEFKPIKYNILSIALVLLVYVALLLYFNRLPRLLFPDETSYIFSARMGLSNGAAPPMGVGPNTSEAKALLQGRFFWIYLLASFIGATGLPAYQAGLLGTIFLVMTGLASSLLVRNKWLSTAVFAIVVTSPLLFLFSALSLNDLAISFYAVFSVLFFLRSFSKVGNSISINITNLLYSFSGIIILTLVKLNLLVFVAMWIVLVYIMLRYKLYKENLKYKIFLIAVLSPVLIYELCLDLPYVISLWIFRSRELADLFGKFLFISPVEWFVRCFLTPLGSPTAPTLFTRSLVDYLEYFYKLLMPESSSLLISAIVLALPIFLLSKSMRSKLEKKLLGWVVLLSTCLFYFEALSIMNLDDVSRYSLWIIPLWIPLALMILQDIKDSSSFRKLLPVSIAALILLWVNIWLSREKGGVYVGYLQPRLWTTDVIIIQLISLTLMLGLLSVREDWIKIVFVNGKKLFEVKIINPRKAMFLLIIILTLLNGVYFSSKFIEKSYLYQDHGLSTLSSTLDDLTDGESLVFANNYIYMRSYISDKLFKQGSLLTLPETASEFLRLVEVSPNNSLFLISYDADTTRDEYADKYIMNYPRAHARVITPEKPNVSRLPKFNLTEPFLVIPFDDANKEKVIDYSGLGNNVVNHGAKLVEGYYGKALRFDGKEYISIPNNYVLNPKKAITIGFFAFIEKAEPSNSYTILSKSDAPGKGYNVYLSDGYIYFRLGIIGGPLSIPAEPYIGAWHHFIFTYDEDQPIQIYVDGIQVASTPGSGSISASGNDLEIGRDGQTQGDCFVGSIDELQISSKPLSIEDLTSSYYTSYALPIHDLPKSENQAAFYRIINKGNEDGQIVSVEDSSLSVGENRTITLKTQIDSPTSKNVTILVGADRFTKVYTASLTTGTNVVKYQYNFLNDPAYHNPGGPYWNYMGQVRLIVLDNSSVVYDKFLTTQNLGLMNILLLVSLCGVLTVYLVAYYRENQRSIHASNPKLDIMG
jgi:hypothetical protein